MHDTWLRCLSNLNVACTGRRGLAPHKPLLLLTIMDMIEDGDITTPSATLNADENRSYLSRLDIGSSSLYIPHIDTNSHFLNVWKFSVSNDSNSFL